MENGMGSGREEDQSVEFLVHEKSDKKRFERFNDLQQSPRTFLVACFIYLVFILSSLVQGLVLLIDTGVKPHQASGLLAALTVPLEFVLLVLVTILIIVRAYGTQHIIETNPILSSDTLPVSVTNTFTCWQCFDFISILKTLRLWKQTAQNAFILSNCLLFSMLLLIKCAADPCSGSSNYWQWKLCSSTSSHDGDPSLPVDYLTALFLVPTAFNLVVRNPNVEVVLFTWIITMLSTALTAIWIDWQLIVVPMIVYGLCSFMIYYESHRQNMAMYTLATKLQGNLAENERTADENHANELRSMIANVAHDLKTPLTSFMNGMNVIEDLIIDCEERLTNTSEGESIITDQITPLRSCLSNVQNTNAFMVMTINRCIDYTKASRGMELVPRPETIDLRETLDLPLRVMRNLQQRLEITLNESSLEGICSHIITDKQWLQENILCLLSNAVKYSTKGKVDIEVSLVPKSRVMKLQPPQVRKDKLNKEKAQQQGDGPAPSKLQYSKISNIFTGVPGNRHQTYGVNSTSSTSATPRSYERIMNSFLVVRTRSNSGARHVSINSKRSSEDGQSVHGSKVLPIESVTEDPTGEVELHDEERNDNHDDGNVFVLVRVQDTGIGMSDAAMKNLFNPFKQAQRLAGGTGLGLYSLAKRLEALGGYYGVRKRKDGEQGSVFWFAFAYRPDVNSAEVSKQRHLHGISSKRSVEIHPFEAEPNHNESGATLTMPYRQSQRTSTRSDMQISDGACNGDISTNEHDSTTTKQGLSMPAPSSGFVSPAARRIMDAHKVSSNLNILLVDDSISILKITSTMLRRHGHIVTEIENGAEALDILRERREQRIYFDCVVMDLQMPVMDGLEAMRRLRAEENTGKDEAHHQFVIGCSANSDHATSQEAYAAGFDAFMNKPFSVDMFYQVIGNMSLPCKK